MTRVKAVLARAGLVGCVLGFGVLLPSAFAQKVDIQYDHDTDFSRIRRYQWRTHAFFEKNPELQEIYATGIQLVHEAGNAQLMKRGLQPDDSSPDAFVTFYLLTNDVQQMKRAAETGRGASGDGRLVGMLVIEIVDAATSKLLWRASCGDKIKDMSKRDKNINSAVRKAFEDFPPK